MKKHLLLLLGILLALPAVARDFDYNTYEGQTIITYTCTVLDEEAKTCELISYEFCGDFSGTIILPSTVSDGSTDYTLTKIGDNTFRGCESLTAVVIPNSVISIGEGSFRECGSLTSVEIPNSVISIGDYAFNRCWSLTSVVIPNSVTSISKAAFYYCIALTSVTIPTSVISIGDEAFRECSLTSVEIPNSVTSIGECAFHSCSNLNSITFGNSVETIDKLAFYDTAITSITIPSSVTYIGPGIFGACVSLENIYVERGNYNYRDVNGVLLDYSMSTLVQYPCGRSYFDIPSSVKTIGNRAFLSWVCHSSVIIPDHVTTIEYGAFAQSKITSIVLPKLLTDIPEGIFYLCQDLTSIEIPNSVSTIGKEAFFRTALTSVVLPNSLTEVEDGVFHDCHDLKSVVIPNSVTSIVSYAFSGCSSLTSLDIPNSVKTIGRYSFSACSNLTSVILGSSVETIDTGAFDLCTSLTSIIIPASVTSLGDYVFSSCKNLKLAKINGDRVLGIDCFSDLNVYGFLVPKSVIEDYQLQYPSYKFISDINFSYTSEDDIFNISKNDYRTLTLSLDNADLAIGFHTDITLPAGLAIAEKDGKPDVYFGENTAAESHVITAAKVDGENKYSINATSTNNDTFNSGNNLLNINVVSGNDLKGGDITLENTVVSLIGDMSYDCDVLTIKVPKIGVEQIILDPNEASLYIGETLKIKADIYPSTTREETITWNSSDESVATVSADGTVTAISVGIANITAACSSVTATCKVTVNPVTAEEITINVRDITLLVGQSDKLTAYVSPDNTTDKTVTWVSDNEAVATVSADGTVTAITVGIANITAACGSVTATCKVNVNARPKTPKQYVRKGDGKSCTFIVMMNLTDDKLTEQHYNFAYGYMDANGINHIISTNSLRYCHTSPQIYNDSKNDFWAFAFWENEDGSIIRSSRRHLDGSEDDEFDSSILNDYLSRSVVENNPDNWIIPTSRGAILSIHSTENSVLYVHTLNGMLIYTKNYGCGIDVYDEISKDQLTANTYILTIKSGDILTSKKIIIR